MAKKKRKKAKQGKNGTAPVGTTGSTQGTGLFGGLAKLLPSHSAEQFLLGAALGAVAAYVLSDEKLRDRLMRSGITLYSGLASGLAEFKEQMADVKAEIEAQQSGVA